MSQLYVVCKENFFYSRHHTLKVKGWKKTCHAKNKQKIRLTAKNVTRSKEKHFIMKKWPIHQENILQTYTRLTIKTQNTSRKNDITDQKNRHFNNIWRL